MTNQNKRGCAVLFIRLQLQIWPITQFVTRDHAVYCDILFNVVERLEIRLVPVIECVIAAINSRSLDSVSRLLLTLKSIRPQNKQIKPKRNAACHVTNTALSRRLSHFRKL